MRQAPSLLRRTDTMAATGVAHPYFPRSIQLAAYTPNDLTYTEIVGVFFAVVGAGLAVSWIVACTCRRAPRYATGHRPNAA